MSRSLLEWSVTEKKKAEEKRRLDKIDLQIRREAEAQKKIEEDKKKELSRKSLEKLKKEDVEISIAETEQRSILKGSEALLKEAEKKLSDAIKSGDMDMVSVGHGLLEVARSRMDGATEQLSILAGKRKICAGKKEHHESYIGEHCKAPKIAKHN